MGKARRHQRESPIDQRIAAFLAMALALPEEEPDLIREALGDFVDGSPSAC